MNIGQLEALAIISALPNDIWLTTEEAAVVLRMSVTTLERLRKSDSTTKGPPYSQAGGKVDEKGKVVRAAGTNQKILYRKGDLLAWLEANMVSDSVAAAVRKGQYFVSLRDLVEEVAFWRNPNGQITGLVDETSLDMFLARLGKWEIVWLPPTDALGERWESMLSQKTLALQITNILTSEKGRVAAFVEKAEIDRIATQGTTGEVKGKAV